MKIGFVGAGKMAQSLAGGIARENVATQFLISDPSLDSQQSFCDIVANTIVCHSNDDVCRQSDIVFLAVKPQQLNVAFPQPPAKCRARFVLSILAGTTIKQLTATLGSDRIVRVMPNTPCLIGKGVLAVAASEQVGQNDLQLVHSLLSPVGMVISVDESKMDIITAISGSGPAYVFRLIEVMVNTGVQQGLDEKTALEIVTQTIVGAGLLVRQTGVAPADLRAAVTSPGGTTQAGIQKMQESGFERAVQAGVLAAADRSRELSRD